MDVYWMTHVRSISLALANTSDCVFIKEDYVARGSMETKAHHLVIVSGESIALLYNMAEEQKDKRVCRTGNFSLEKA